MDSWKAIFGMTIVNSEILDCTYVYAYRFNKHGILQKCKARLVVRRDQQPARGNDATYVAPLAGRSFRTSMALAVRSDLDPIQFDAANAFVNAKLDEVVYMQPPRGCREDGYLLAPNQALYGLRKPPLLWQRGLLSTLLSLGFEATPHEPCCVAGAGILLFFCIDDVVLGFQNTRRRRLAPDRSSASRRTDSPGR